MQWEMVERKECKWEGGKLREEVREMGRGSCPLLHHLVRRRTFG